MGWRLRSVRLRAPSAGANAAQRCFRAGSRQDSCIGEQFHECVAERCRIWDGSSKDCEEDANAAVHRQASNCGTTATSANPYALLTQSLDFADKDITAFTENVKRLPLRQRIIPTIH